MIKQIDTSKTLLSVYDPATVLLHVKSDKERFVTTNYFWRGKKKYFVNLIMGKLRSYLIINIYALERV